MIENFSKEKCLDIYKYLKLGRRFEEKTIELGNNGEIPGSLHAGVGMEAIGVGISLALKEGDITFKTHRGHATMIAEGADIRYMLSEIMGKANGYNKGMGGSMHLAGISGVLGSNTHMAAGAALAFKIRKEKRVAVAYYGDGSANQGPVHEAMNMAAIWKLPIIFVCENNQYAVTTSINDATLLKNLSERACAYGFPGITVDGMDVIKVYNAASNLIEQARDGKGPALLECNAYRFLDHSVGTANLKLNYRSNDEIEAWKKRDPIINWSEKLIDEQICSKNDLLVVDSWVDKTIDEAVDFARNSKLPEPEDAFKDMYATKYDGIPQRGW
jgi:acetoin:2,6-dichlorophenolindophenol oxidoreductase subunit alpha